jgi:hypothetical protein
MEKEVKIMPKLNAHTAISRQRTGFEFEELHRWIDNGYGSEKLGSDHRIEKHAYNKRDMETIRDYWNSLKGPGWGEKAVIE